MGPGSRPMWPGQLELWIFFFFFFFFFSFFLQKPSLSLSPGALYV